MFTVWVTLAETSLFREKRCFAFLLLASDATSLFPSVYSCWPPVVGGPVRNTSSILGQAEYSDASGLPGSIPYLSVSRPLTSYVQYSTPLSDEHDPYLPSIITAREGMGIARSCQQSLLFTPRVSLSRRILDNLLEDAVNDNADRRHVAWSEPPVSETLRYIEPLQLHRCIKCALDSRSGKRIGGAVSDDFD